MAKKESDAFGLHEVLHMSDFLARAINNELIEHPEIKKRPKWSKLAQKAAESLAALYQEIGQGAVARR